MTLSDKQIENHMGWFNIDNELPEDKQKCELIIEFTFVSILGDDLEKINNKWYVNGVFAKDISMWIIHNTDLPAGFLKSKVTHWRPI
jgi:hypothetical protein